ncbi:MAG: ribosome recycling factor [Gammaproteobacteria bacterium]|nr:ribosome recycling factor [Gammaproteobacteria bacterium]MCY4217781.1 ribosome recycling factor [Gammaproteobacteria bacterium]MCY4274457.1 ribosome recycling factor [Gammaproteobacteria bacterium]
MIEDIKKDAEQRMRKTVTSTRDSMARIRTGRATTALLDHLSVNYYGSQVPINQVATVSVADARTLTVQPWEKQMLEVVEKAILESDLGLNPMTAGEVMRIPLPAMTEERRVELSRVVRQEGENGKVAIRNIRRDAIHTVRELLKEKEITQDEEKGMESTLQTLTDQYIQEIAGVVEEKQNEVMDV